MLPVTTSWRSKYFPPAALQQHFSNIFACGAQQTLTEIFFACGASLLLKYFSPAARNKHLPKYFSPAALQQFSNIFRLRRATNTYRNILRLRRFTSSQVFFVCGATTLLKYFSPAAYNHLSIKYFRLWHTINTNLNYFSNLKYFSPAALQHTYQIFFNTAPPLPPSPNFERHW